MISFPKIDYVRPDTVEAAVAYLADASKKAIVFAGGTDILVQLKGRGPKCHVACAITSITPVTAGNGGKIAEAEQLIDIKKIPELGKLEVDENGNLIIGAAVTLDELARFCREHEAWADLEGAAMVVGSEQVRNRATVVGNICRASPCADTVPVLVCLGAKVEVAGPQGHRAVLLEELITGPGTVALSSEEMVVAVRVPEPGPGSSLVYLKHGIRRAMEIAIVSVAALICTDLQSKAVARARITLGSVAPTPIRVEAAEVLLEKKGVSRQTLTEASELAARAAQPISDIRGSAEYRREMVKVFTRRALEKAWENSK